MSVQVTHHDRARTYGKVAAGVVVIWALIAGALTGIGKLIMAVHQKTPILH